MTGPPAAAAGGPLTLTLAESDPASPNAATTALVARPANTGSASRRIREFFTNVLLSAAHVGAAPLHEPVHAGTGPCERPSQSPRRSGMGRPAYLRGVAIGHSAHRRRRSRLLRPSAVLKASRARARARRGRTRRRIRGSRRRGPAPPRGTSAGRAAARAPRRTRPTRAP